jgi:hypothetical protein
MTYQEELAQRIHWLRLVTAKLRELEDEARALDPSGDRLAWDFQAHSAFEARDSAEGFLDPPPKVNMAPDPEAAEDLIDVAPTMLGEFFQALVSFADDWQVPLRMQRLCWR